MNIPIDIKTLLAGVTDVEAARTVPLSVLLCAGVGA